MPRIRSVKPSFWSDTRVCSLTRDQRLLLLALISVADDEGRFVASAASVGGYAFPQDDIPTKTIQRWLDTLAEAGLIELYQVSGQRYGRLPNWAKHQHINRPTPSVLPAPSSLNGHGALTERLTEPSVRTP